MKYFLPDSQDMVDPSFDFETETRSEHRLRQHDDLYAHEVFDKAPFDGLLVSMAIVEGPGGLASGRYTIAQRHRLRRVGARAFFRLPATSDTRAKIELMGDCGAFSYVKEPEPVYSTREVVDFYVDCGFDFGISVDHAIMGFKPEYDSHLPGLELVPPDWLSRQEVTLIRAREFLEECDRRNASFEPMAVAHGWSPRSYTTSFDQLQSYGYKTIALGGMVPLKTPDVLSVLSAIDEVREPTTKIHLLGISRIDHVLDFAEHGVASFDSTSPLRKAFKDERDNYYTPSRTYSAIRIPQVGGNPSLMRRIRAGLVDQAAALELEKASLEAMASFDAGSATVEDVLAPLGEYEKLFETRRSRIDRYREVLEASPWKHCSCDVCKKLGYHVILFRGAERNRRRGFHNIFVFHRRLAGTFADTKGGNRNQ